MGKTKLEEKLWEFSIGLRNSQAVRKLSEFGKCLAKLARLRNWQWSSEFGKVANFGS